MGLTTKIGLTLIIGAVIVAAMISAAKQEPPVPQGVTRVDTFGNPPPGYMGVEEAKPAPMRAFEFKDDSKVTHEVLSINRQGEDLIDIMFYDSTGEPAVRINADGSVQLFRDPDSAAKAFWQAVATSMPLCRKTVEAP